MAEASLTEGLVALLSRPTMQADRHRAALHVVDWIGCAAAGATGEVGEVVRRHIAMRPAGTARVLLGGRTTGRNAAFANGAFGNVLEMDDVHRTAVLHPGPVVIPAALALAAERQASGTALLEAILRGYEAEIRIGRAMGPGHCALFHPTATMGPFGAAAACGALLGLDVGRMVWALGNAGTQTGGVRQCRRESVMTRQLHTARAAAMGLESAELAEAGMSGGRHVLEGPQGVFAALATDARADLVLAAPDAPWLIHETSFKPWPACRHAHPAIAAALALRPRIGERQIAALRLQTYAEALSFCDRQVPQTTLDAKSSLQHAVAVSLLDGPPTLAAFDPPALARADVAALRARIAVEEDGAFSRAYPARSGAALGVTLADGTELRESVADALGDPENPLDDAAILAKARMLMDSVGISGKRAEAVIAAALALVEGGPVARLNDSLP